MGKTTDDLVRLAHDVSRDPHGREMDMLLTAGERISMALLCMAVIDLGVHAVSFTGSQAGIVTDTVHGKAKILEIKGDRIRDRSGDGHGRGRRRVPGHLHRPGHHHAGPRRLRHHRGRAGGSARRRSVRDLHRRLGRVHRRPAPRSAGPQVGAGFVRRDARDGSDRRQGAGAAVGRVRSQPRRSGARPLRVHLGAGHVGRRGGSHHGTSDHLRCHPRQLGSEGHDRAGGRPARRGGVAVPRAGRRGRERRHDRAERVDRRSHRHLVHRARATICTGRSR